MDLQKLFNSPNNLLNEEDLILEEETKQGLGFLSEQIIASMDQKKVVLTKKEDFFAPPANLEETGLNPIVIQDLLLKTLFFQNQATGKELAAKLRLPLHGIIDPVMMALANEQFVEISGSSSLGGHNKTYRLTRQGFQRAKEALSASNYIGPAPVSLKDYIQAVKGYSNFHFDEKALREAYKDLIIEESMFDKVGPAILSNKSLFLYGPPGTGKTSIAERLIKTSNDEGIYIPYAINVQGHSIRFFDYFWHHPLEGSARQPLDSMKDGRWIKIRRPCVIVGPEYSIASSDLQYDPSGPSYQFPSSIKANGGIFIVDDFGRQKEDPEVLLNRWIMPLDKQQDILNLKTGQQVLVPFKVFTVFSTNLNPRDLVDEAFLRRLAYKLKVDYPSLETFCKIFALEANRKKIVWSDESLDYFVSKHYYDVDRPFRACDPKDILNRVIDITKFKKIKTPIQLTKELIDAACNSYFVLED